MAKLEPVAIQIIGLEDMRRLSAALEQYNAGSRGDAAQINRLEAHLTDARGKLTVLERATVRAVAILNGDPCPAPLPGEPLSVIEEAALSAKGAARRASEIGRVQRELSEARDELAYAYNIIKNRNMRLPDSSYKTDLLNEIASLVDRDVRREIGADHAETKQQLAVALDRIHQLEQVHDQQVGALTAARNNVDAFQRDLARTQADTSQAIAMLEGRRSATLNQTEVNNKLLRTVSDIMRALESNSGSDRVRNDLSEAHERICKQNDVIARLEADLRKEQKIKSFVNDECQKTRAALGLGRMAQAPEVLAAIDALQVDASMKQHTIDGLRGRAHDLEQTIAKAAPVESDKKLADALKMRLAEANDTIAKQADVIKHMHEEYHQLQARKQGADYDLERAKEEIAFAEAEAAKYKPLIEAVRAGHVYAAFGEWVIPEAGTATRAGLYREIKITYSVEDKRCL